MNNADIVNFYKNLNNEKLSVYKKLIFCIMIAEKIKDKDLENALKRIKENGLHIRLNVFLQNYLKDFFGNTLIPIQIKAGKLKISFIEITKDLAEIEQLLDSIVLIKYVDKLTNFFEEKDLKTIGLI